MRLICASNHISSRLLDISPGYGTTESVYPTQSWSAFHWSCYSWIFSPWLLGPLPTQSNPAPVTLSPTSTHGQVEFIILSSKHLLYLQLSFHFMASAIVLAKISSPVLLSRGPCSSCAVCMLPKGTWLRAEWRQKSNPLSTLKSDTLAPVSLQRISFFQSKQSSLS